MLVQSAIHPREFARARPDGAMITVRGRRNAASFLGLIQRRWGSLKYEYYLYFKVTHCLCRRRHFEDVGEEDEEGMSNWIQRGPTLRLPLDPVHHRFQG
jgi:hypothetical protein